MQLIEVTDASGAEEFLQVNVKLNQANPHYIRPLDKDIHEVFDREKNKTFRFGEVTRWILKDDSNNLIGRIAAFTNSKYKNKGDDLPIGGTGFFECINDQAAADMLFDISKHWLLQRGMEAMDGPINFGERDRWWGLLVEGFEPPVYCLNFNPPYYANLFEQYGFKVFFNQVCFARKVQGHVNEKFYQRHANIKKDHQFSSKHIDKKNLRKFAGDFTEIYNKAWAGHGGLKQMHKEVVLKMLQSMKPIMDEKIVWFVYHNDKPIGMWINLPDVNQWFKYLHGKFNWFAKLKFLWIKATKPCTKFTGIVFGIVPEFQGMGVDSYLIMEAAEVMRGELKYEDFEMQWIGDFNPKMLNIGESLDTYR
ncbi:MAG TPA: hypothetical protein VEZ17_01770, partial [Chitinophagaceae bacterium]|nr:hypothetical protein [Chitinophagaceae bacterium]